MRILVTGGAGFIGSHTVVQLVEAGHTPVILDNFCNAHRSVGDRLDQIVGTHVEVRDADLRDEAALQQVFQGGDRVDAVIHFAGLKAVGESVEKPLEYYENNISGTLTLLRAMRDANVRRLVFSSSATVYGATASPPLTEDLPTSAINPYGWTKVQIEQILRDVAAADPTWRIAILRYFNPVGAHTSGLIGEDPVGIPNNLMPVICRVADGRLDKLQVFGNDYDTPDGTGVRDYIHVNDLAAGHLAALTRVAESDEPLSVWNLGTGRGVSVLELVHAFERASGVTIPFEIAPRRPGDVAVSYADPTKAITDLDWKAERTVDDMCEDTWRWISKKR